MAPAQRYVTRRILNALIPLPKSIWPKLMVRAESAEFLEIKQ